MYVCTCACMNLVKSRFCIEEQALFCLPPLPSSCLFGSFASPCIFFHFHILLLVRIWNASWVCRAMLVSVVPILVSVLLKQAHSWFKDTEKRRQQSRACCLLRLLGLELFSCVLTAHGSNPIWWVWLPKGSIRKGPLNCTLWQINPGAPACFEICDQVGRLCRHTATPVYWWWQPILFCPDGSCWVNDGVSQVQITVAFLPSIIQTMNAFAWLIWMILDLVSVVPKIKENILNARYLRWAQSAAAVQVALVFVQHAWHLLLQWPVLSCLALPRWLGCIFQGGANVPSSRLHPPVSSCSCSLSSCGDFSVYWPLSNPMGTWVMVSVGNSTFPFLPVPSWAIALLHTSLDISR